MGHLLCQATDFTQNSRSGTQRAQGRFLGMRSKGRPARSSTILARVARAVPLLPECLKIFPATSAPRSAISA